MKNIFLLLITFCFITFGFAQKDVRTVSTKVADLLMQFPAKNSADLTNITSQLAEVGPEAVEIISKSLMTSSLQGSTQLKYAMSGLVKYLSKQSNSQISNATANAIIIALSQELSIENKNFLLEQLKFIISDNHLSSIYGFLLKDDYVDATARILTNIKSNEANRLLMTALDVANDFQKGFIIQAIGTIGNVDGLNLLKKNYEEFNAHKSNILKNFTEHSYTNGLDIISKEAANEGFAGGVNSATDQYLAFSNKLISAGKTEGLKDALNSILNAPSAPNNVKIAAIQQLAKFDKNAVLPILKNFISQNNVELRQTSLNIMSQFKDITINNDLLGQLSKSKDPTLNLDLLTYFTNNSTQNSTPVISKLLKSKDDGLKIGAMNALFANDPKVALKSMQGLIKSGSPNVVAAAQNILLRTSKEDFKNFITSSFAKSSSSGKLALLELIGKRKSKDFTNLVLKESQNKNTVIRDKAIAQLGPLSDAKLIPDLFKLLGTTNEAVNIKNIQNAIILGSNNGSKNQLLKIIEANSTVVNQVQNYKLFQIYSHLGGENSLNFVKNAVKKDPKSLEVGLDAFDQWHKGQAIDEIFSLISTAPNESLKNKAISSYIRNVNRTEMPEDQRLLLLRKVQPQLTDVEQKKQLIRQASQINTLQSLNVIAQYLDENKATQTAINGIFNIILNSDLYGKYTRDIVNKAIKLNADSEAKYIEEAVVKKMSTWPSDDGFMPMFNGRDLTGWKGLVENPIARSKMSKEQLADAQRKADDKMRKDWSVENGVLVFDAEGYNNLCSEKMYADFEMLVDWRMEPKGDGGVYLRGSPQVQTWDTSRRDAGAQVGSGGLYNNQSYKSKPLLVADNPINEWNTFRIKMIGDKVTVYLNGQLVTDNVILENYWDRKIPIFEKESIELQAHGTRLEFREVYVREIVKVEAVTLAEEEVKEGFVPLFNGLDLENWTGNKVDYFAQEGMIVCQPSGKGSGNLFTAKEYDDFTLRFEFQLTPGANNGLGVRTPKEGDPAYVGMELQILDNTADIYKSLYDWQYHGSVYGVLAAKKGFSKPLGEWNVQEVHMKGNYIKITLNGVVIVEGDLNKVSDGGKKTIDGKEHPGLLNKKGYIGFLGHGSPLKFRNIRIKEIK